MKQTIKFKPKPIGENGNINEQLKEFCKKLRKSGKNGRTHIIGIKEEVICKIYPQAMYLGLPIYADGFRVKVL